MEEIKKFIQKAGPFRIGIVVLCGLLLLFLSFFSPISQSTNEEIKQEINEKEVTETSLTEYKKNMETELVALLQKVQGVGSTKVMITLKASNEKVTLKDASSKGEQLDEETVLTEDSENNTSPYVIQEREPEIEGIVVVCTGGDNAAIKREITEAVSALFQIESHKIKIMKSKEAKE